MSQAGWPAGPPAGQPLAAGGQLFESLPENFLTGREGEEERKRERRRTEREEGGRSSKIGVEIMDTPLSALLSALCSSICYLSSTRDLLSLYGSLGFSGSVLLQGVPERALSSALQALLSSGRFSLSHALLRCDGDEMLCESASACPP